MLSYLSGMRIPNTNYGGVVGVRCVLLWLLVGIHHYKNNIDSAISAAAFSRYIFVNYSYTMTKNGLFSKSSKIDHNIR